MKYIMIQNNGEIDPKHFFLMGVTSKREDDATIGQFGTGTKYGIAALLRFGHELIIFSGEKRIDFSTKKISFRGEEYNHITYKIGKTKKDTGITLEMGKLNWTAQRGFRELVSNALDEGGFSIRNMDSPEGFPGTTRVFISNVDGAGRLDEDFDRYFLINREPIYSGHSYSIYQKYESKGTRVYRKGVLVYESRHNSLYDYCLDTVHIGEDRTSGTYAVSTSLAMAVNKFPVEFKKRILEIVYDENSIESEAVNTYHTPSADWLDAIGDRYIATAHEMTLIKKMVSVDESRVIVVPSAWRKFLRQNDEIKLAKDLVGEKTLQGWEESETDEYTENLLSDIISMLTKIGYYIKREEIIVSNNTKDESVFGQYVDGKIYIDKKSLRRGFDDSLDTIFEEMMHRDSNENDCTRGFQEYLKKECLRHIKRLAIR